MKQLLSLCPEPVRGEVLEVGAGYGWTSRRILDNYPQVELTATDIDRDATDEFAGLEKDYGKRLKVLEADLRSLPFDRAMFDIVIAANVLQRLEDPGEGVRQMLRVVRPGGLVGLVGNVKLLPRERIVDFLAEEDCKVEVVRGGGIYLIWARKAFPVEMGK